MLSKEIYVKIEEKIKHVLVFRNTCIHTEEHADKSGEKKHKTTVHVQYAMPLDTM